MKQKLFALFAAVALLLGMSACTNEDNPAPEAEVTLMDALNDGTVVVLTFNLNGEDFYAAFIRVGDTYELLDYDKVAWTRGDEPALSEQDCDFSMEHDKANDLLKFYVKEKKTSDLVLTAIIDIKQSTVEVIPGNSQIKVTGFKMKVSDVEVTNLLKDVSGNVTLADALKNGAKVEITYKWNGHHTTVFTFINDGGTFASKITGEYTEFVRASLTSEGNTLFFSAKDWTSSDYDLEIKFNVVSNTYTFWTVTHDIYTSHTISVNGTDLTSKIKRES